jgi:hypothetical protein
VTDDDPQISAAYRRLVAAQDQVEHREFRRGARERWMRVNELVETEMTLDDARDRRTDAVLDARRIGMTWAAIAEALHMTEDEARQEFAAVDSRVDPGRTEGPTQYEW